MVLTSQVDERHEGGGQLSPPLGCWLFMTCVDMCVCARVCVCVRVCKLPSYAAESILVSLDAALRSQTPQPPLALPFSRGHLYPQRLPDTFSKG